MLQALLDGGWSYHDSESARLAGELEAAAQAGVPSDLLSPFLHLAMHTIGERLGDWPRALALGKRILQGRENDASAAKAAERVIIAAILAGDAVYAAELELVALAAAPTPLSGFLATRLLLAEVLIGTERRAEGAQAYRSCLSIAARSDAPSALSRRIAATSNNIAWTLHELASRSAEENGLMQLAAETSLAAWRQGGDWINVELALYLRARVAQAVGDPSAALSFSTEGLEVIAANGKRPFDAARFHLLRCACFTALGDGQQRLEALAAADRAAEGIAIEGLKAQFAEERAATAS